MPKPKRDRFRKPMRKLQFEGFTTHKHLPCWTYYNTLNHVTVIQKTKLEAMARYEDGLGAKNIVRVRVTFEYFKD